MKRRCLNKNAKNYHRYGGRGISLCEEWLNYKVFQKWALYNGYDDFLCIDRINNEGNYEPNNCRWITRSQNTKKVCEDRDKLFSELNEKIVILTNYNQYLIDLLTKNHILYE